MEAKILVQGINDPPQLANIKQPVVDLTLNEKITFCLVEKGMQSGEPSVIIVTEDEDGSVALQTSFDKFLMAATGMMALAETNFNWKRPEGYASLAPNLSREQRKEILESIKTELEGFDDG